MRKVDEVALVDAVEPKRRELLPHLVEGREDLLGAPVGQMHDLLAPMSLHVGDVIDGERPHGMRHLEGDGAVGARLAALADKGLYGLRHVLVEVALPHKADRPQGERLEDPVLAVGHVDDVRPKADLAQRTPKLDAVDARHLDVEKNEVKAHGVHPLGQVLEHGVDLKLGLRAAKGEVESFQLIPIAGKKPAEVKIAFSGFRSADGATLPEGTATWGVIRDITAKQTMLGNTTEERRNYVGSWPDMIEDGNPAEIQIPAGGAVPVFFRVTVPRDAKPGDYRGVITLSNESGRKELPVELHVWPFEIPARNSIPVVFSFFLSNYRQWYGLDKITPEQNDMITRFLVSYRIPPNNIYESGIYPSIADQKKYDLNFATVGYFFDKKPLSEKELEARLAKFRPRLKAIEEAGVQDNIYFYTFDEIVGMWPEEHHNTFAAAKQVLGRFKQEFPWLRRLQTSIPHPDLRDTFDIWCPLFSYFNVRNHDVEKLQAEGVELWWYAADSPAKPFPNFFLGYPLNDLRVIMTLTYMKNSYRALAVAAAASCADEASFDVKSCGASNSLIFHRGRIEAYNTDIGGFLKPLTEVIPSLKGKKCLVFGAGGAAAACVCALADRGADVTVLNRTVEKAQRLATRFGCAFGSLEDAAAIKNAAILVQASAAGMTGFEATDPAAAYVYSGNEIAYDIVYKPRETPFLKRAAAAGCRCLYGLEMLEAQARLQFDLFYSPECGLWDERDI